MRNPTGVKFCTMVSTKPSFIMPVQNFGDTPQKNFRGQKHAKFSPISDDFEVRRRISPKQLLGAPPPLKFGRAKNVQNLVRFTTTFKCAPYPAEGALSAGRAYSGPRSLNPPSCIQGVLLQLKEGRWERKKYIREKKEKEGRENLRQDGKGEEGKGEKGKGGGHPSWGEDCLLVLRG